MILFLYKKYNGKNLTRMKVMCQSTVLFPSNDGVSEDGGGGKHQRQFNITYAT